MLGEKIEAHQAQIWLVNTGWTGGAYGEGSRISLKYTRALISAVLDGKLSHAEFQNLEGFDLAIPTSCDGVPKDILNPRNTWKDPLEYDEKSAELIELFQDNFNKNIKTAGKEILEAQPKLLIG